MGIMAVQTSDPGCSHTTKSKTCFHKNLVPLHSISVKDARRHRKLQTKVIFKFVTGAKKVIKYISSCVA